jgi:hypothetical protein
MSESKQPPRLPDVVDEAGDSPRWIPWLGLAVLCLVAFVLAAQNAVDLNRSHATSAADAGTEQPTTAAPAK